MKNIIKDMPKLTFMKIVLPILSLQVPIGNSKEMVLEEEVEESKPLKKLRVKKGKETSYIVSEEEAEISFELFKEMTSKGVRGLCITK
jgi:hypothetical protein